MTSRQSNAGDAITKVYFYFFLAILNSVLLYVLLEEVAILYGTLVLVILLLFIYINVRFNSSEKKRDIPATYSPSTGDFVRLMLKYLKVNRKFIIATGLGLVITCLVIAQAFIISSSYQQYAFEDYIEGSNTNEVYFSISSVANTSFFEFESVFETSKEAWVSSYDLELQDGRIWNSLELEFMMGEQTTITTRTVDTKSFRTREWTPYYYDLLSQLPTFPDLKFEEVNSLLVLPSAVNFQTPEFGSIAKDPSEFLTQTDNGFAFKILVDQEYKRNEEAFDPSYIFENITVETDNFWKWTKEDIVYIDANNLKFPNELLYGSFFLPQGEEWGLYEQLQNKVIEVNETQFIWGKPYVEGYININIPTLGDTNIEEFSLKVLKIYDYTYEIIVSHVREFEPYFSRQTIAYDIYSPLQIILEEYQRYEQNLSDLMIIFSAPLVLTSLFLFYFAITIVEREKIIYFRRLKIRGASISMFQGMIFAEIATYAILGPIIGLIGGVLSSFLLLNTIEIFEGLGGLIPLIIPNSLYWKLPAIGAILALDLNLPTVFSTNSLRFTTFTDTDGDDGIGFLSSTNLDIIMFVLSLLYWFSIPFINVNDEASNLIYQQLGFVAIAFTIISLPLITNRFFFPFLAWLIQVVPYQIDVLFIATKSILGHKKYTTKFVALLLISLLFAFIGIVTTSTTEDMNDKMTEYSLGADLYISGMRDTNITEWELLYVDGVEAATPIVQMFYQPNQIETVSGERVEDEPGYEFLGIDPTSFAEVVDWDDSFGNTQLETMVNGLVEDFNVGLPYGILDAYQIEEGDIFNFRHGFRARSNFPLRVNTSFEFFPVLVREDVSQVQDMTDIDNHYILGNIHTVEILTRSAARVPYYGALIKTEPGADISEISTQIYRNLVHTRSITIFSAENNGVSIFGSSTGAGSLSPLAKFEEQIVFSSLTTILLISFSTTVLGILYYAYVIYATRKREIGVYRSLGMVRKDLTRILLVELGIMVVSSLAIALLFGLFLSERIFAVLTGNAVTTVPPFELTIPEVPLLLFSLLLGGVSLLLSYIPANFMATRKTANILREE